MKKSAKAGKRGSGEAEKTYYAIVRDYGGACWRNYEFVIFFGADIKIKGTGFTLKRDAVNKGEEIAKQFGIKIKWTRERR